MKVDKAYCVNLAHRKDRWRDVWEEFLMFGIEPEQFTAIKNVQGFIGCMLSHLAVIEKCKKVKTFAIFEDDVRFVASRMYPEIPPEEVPMHMQHTYSLATSQLPDDWDLLYLGGNPQRPLERYSDNLFRAKGVLCHHAVIYNNHRIARYILDHIEDVYRHQKIDVYFADVIQEKFNAYIVWPIIATQADSYSDITKRENKYFDYIINQFNAATHQDQTLKTPM